MKNFYFFTALLFFSVFVVQAQTTTIPDDNFENYLETHAEFGAVVPIGDPTAMGNGIANDNLVTTANINTVTFLDVSSVGNIADLTGIQDFAALDTLICEANELTNLDLSQNSMLTGLFANANQLIQLNVQNGNNMNVTSFMTNNNPDLYCIQVDDVSFSTTNWTNIDSQSSFSLSCGTLSGVVSYDCTSAIPQQNVQLKATASNSGNIYYTTTNNLGEYAFNINENGTIIIETVAPNLMSTPANQTNTSNGQDIPGLDFCVDSINIGDDVHITLVPLTPAPRPGFTSLYKMCYGNYGSTTVSGDITFTYEDTKIGSVSSSDSFTQNNNVLTWNYTNLAPFEIRCIDVILNVNPATGANAVIAGDFIFNSVVINPTAGDIFVQDNYFQTEEIVVNGYDPNDVTIYEGPYIQPSQSSDYLNFRIRFQNTGTASAINIDVKTDLDANMDLSTFTLLGSSHTMNTSILNQNEVTFSFPNINLDYEANDEPASHGWVTFKIKPVAGFAIGDIISSQASIYFDTNAAIITNNATVQIAPPSLTYVPDNNFENYIETHDASGTLVGLGGAGNMGNGAANDDYVTTANINTVTSLDVEDQEIASLTGIEDFTALQILFSQTNLLTNIDVSSNTNLTTLFCNNNALTSLDVTQNPNLTQLSAGSNQLSSIAINPSAILSELFIYENIFTTFDASIFTGLIDFRCQDNQLTSLNVANGNNINFISFEAANNPTLNCIEVDDAAWSTTNWINIDPASSFSEDCSLSTHDFEEVIFSIYPNPAQSTIQIKGLVSLEKYTLYNAIGVQVARGEAQDNTVINVQSLTTGLYFLKFEKGNTIKFIKE